MAVKVKPLEWQGYTLKGCSCHTQLMSGWYGIRRDSDNQWCVGRAGIDGWVQIVRRGFGSRVYAEQYVQDLHEQEVRNCIEETEATDTATEPEVSRG